MTAKRPTIGLFTDTYVPQINGVATLLPIMDRLLREEGHEVYIFAPSYEKHGWSREGERVFRFPALKFAFHKESRVTLPYHREAWQAFEQLDIVHSQTPFSLGVLGIRVARKHNIPHLHTYHTLFTEYLHYLPRVLRPSPRMVGSISAAFCNRCDAVTAPSSAMVDELRSYDVSVPIYLLPFGMDMEDFSGPPEVDCRESQGLSADDRVLLCAGRLAREKNVSHLLGAFERVLRKLPNVKLLIVGDGPARAELEREAAELGIASNVIFTGYLPWRTLIDYYKGADLFVYASKTETQGIVFMEAMASGLPVVAVGEMGAAETVVHGVTGLLVGPEEDEAAFAGAVLELLGDEDRLEQLRAGALKEAERTSIQRSLERLQEIYGNLIEAHRAPGHASSPSG